MKGFPIRSLLPALVAALVATLVVPPAAATAAPTGRVAGEVVSWSTGQPVAGATVRLPELGVSTRSGPDGSFSFPEPLPTRDPYRRIDAVVSASGYGRWTIERAPLYPDDTLLLHAELRERDVRHRVRSPEEREAEPQVSALGGGTCTGWDYNLVPPPTIRVYLTEQGVAREYDFYFYATHVLPNEWIASWDGDALAAGAVAVKTYAQYRARSGNGFSSGEGCADVVDTVADQIFDPTWSHASTNQAVYVAMGSMLLRGGEPFLAQYWSGSPGDPCAPVTSGTFAGRMSQWGTKTCADQGRLWPGITTTFYQNTSWSYLRNMVLNPSLEANVGTYPWGGGRYTTLTRTNGSGYKGGKWFLVATHDPGKWAWAHVDMPVEGTTSSTYTSAAAFRCPAANSSPCTVTINVKAITSSGTTVSRKRTVTIRRDRTWHYISFAPSVHEVAHDTVQLSFLSDRTLHIDTARLQTPFGGS